MAQLTLKRIGQDDFAVMADNRLAGRIMLKPLPSGAVWFWTMTGPHLQDQLPLSMGDVENLEPPIGALRYKWGRIHDWDQHCGLTLGVRSKEAQGELQTRQEFGPSSRVRDRVNKRCIFCLCSCLQGVTVIDACSLIRLRVNVRSIEGLNNAELVKVD